jgi:hypothetical protein
MLIFLTIVAIASLIKHYMVTNLISQYVKNVNIDFLKIL